MPDTVEPPGRNLVPRLQFIEWRLFWEGHINRSDLEERFGVSTPQASVDLRHYKELAGANIEYNATQKRYVASKNMRPRFLRVSANHLLLQLRALANEVLRLDDLWFSEKTSGRCCARDRPGRSYRSAATNAGRHPKSTGFIGALPVAYQLTLARYRTPCDRFRWPSMARPRMVLRASGVSRFRADTHRTSGQVEAPSPLTQSTILNGAARPNCAYAPIQI